MTDWHSLIPLTGCIIWPFQDAPAELQALSPHGGDEDHVAVMRTEAAFCAPFFDDNSHPWFGSHISHHDIDGFMVAIGAHV